MKRNRNWEGTRGESERREEGRGKESQSGDEQRRHHRNKGGSTDLIRDKQQGEADWKNDSRQFGNMY